MFVLIGACYAVILIGSAIIYLILGRKGMNSLPWISTVVTVIFTFSSLELARTFFKESPEIIGIVFVLLWGALWSAVGTMTKKNSLIIATFLPRLNPADFFNSKS